LLLQYIQTDAPIGIHYSFITALQVEVAAAYR